MVFAACKVCLQYEDTDLTLWDTSGDTIPLNTGLKPFIKLPETRNTYMAEPRVARGEGVP